jgi:hypothetical protein
MSILRLPGKIKKLMKNLLLKLQTLVVKRQDHHLVKLLK